MRMLFSPQEIRKAYGLFIGKQALSSILSLGSAVLIARKIGPQAYGIYFICITALEYLIQACQFGIPPFLYREEHKNFQNSLNYFFTFSFLAALILSFFVFFILLLFPFSRSELVSAGRIVIFTLPLVILSGVLRITLEKTLESKKIVSIEILSHLVFLAVGSFLALKGFGVLAPLFAWWAQNLIQCFLFFKLSSFRLRFQFQKTAFKNLLGNGLPIVGVSLISGAQGLVLSALTSLRLGVSSTGELGLVRKIISRASFLQVPNTRLTQIVCGNHIEDKGKLTSFISSNLLANTIAFGILFSVLAWIPSFVFEKVLGPDWRGAHQVLPWLCLAAFISSSFYVLNATLLMLAAHRERFIIAIISLTVLTIAALLFLPRYGIRGWAMAEAVASLSSFLALGSVLRLLGPVKWGKALSSAVLFGAICFLRIVLQ